MDGECWNGVYRAIWWAAKRQPRTLHVQHNDLRIVEVYLWAVKHHRPICWACRRHHWPTHLRARPLPSPATMSRRLRRTEVQRLLKAVFERLQRRLGPSGYAAIDGKPLPIGGHSKDPDAGYGRAAAGMAKGDKLHCIWDSGGRVLAWAVAAMNISEQAVARRLIPTVAGQACFLLADGNYDANPLHDTAGPCGIQLLTHRRYRRAKGLGHQQQSVWRMRALRMLDDGLGPLLRIRTHIERHFGSLGNFADGLGPLPNWVRRQHRVEAWVQGKLILNTLRILAHKEHR